MLLKSIWFDTIPAVFKEWAKEMIDEAVLRSLQFGIGHGLKKEGKPHFNQLIKDYISGEQILLSQYIHALDGFDYESHIEGLTHLEAIKDKPILVVANHPFKGPLRAGHAQRIVINYYVDKITQQEIRWLHGMDKTSPEKVTRNRFAQQSNTIPVRNKDPEASIALIRQALNNKDIIGLHPEGDGNKTLLRGKPKAGSMIIFCALRNYSIVCATTRFQNDRFFLTFVPPLDNEKIKRLARVRTADRNLPGQVISDYAMSIIAQHLPEQMRGYYSESDTFISMFNALTP